MFFKQHREYWPSQPCEYYSSVDHTSQPIRVREQRSLYHLPFVTVVRKTFFYFFAGDCFNFVWTFKKTLLFPHVQPNVYIPCTTINSMMLLLFMRYAQNLYSNRTRTTAIDCIICTVLAKFVCNDNTMPIAWLSPLLNRLDHILYRHTPRARARIGAKKARVVRSLVHLLYL